MAISRTRRLLDRTPAVMVVFLVFHLPPLTKPQSTMATGTTSRPPLNGTSQNPAMITTGGFFDRDTMTSSGERDELLVFDLRMLHPKFDGKSRINSSLVFPQSRSLLFQKIYDDLPTLIGKWMYRSMFSCQNRCGDSTDCSCKPICLILRTCCADFLNVCGDFYDISTILEEFKWLSSASTECLLGSQVVTSCSARNEEQQREYQQALADSYNTILNDHLDKLIPEEIMSSDINSEQKVSLLDAFRLILSTMSNRDQHHLSQTETMLMTVPIIDRSSGISYRNFSMYICNGANLSQAVPWRSYVSMSQTGIIPTSRIGNVEDLLEMQSPCKITINTPYLSPFSEKYLERCEENSIEKCPNDFLDDDVKIGCEQINAIFRVDRELGGLPSSEYYKNPFCAVCNLGLGSDVTRTDVGDFYSSKHYIPKGWDSGCKNLKFLLNPSKNADNFTIVHSFHSNFILPFWISLSCNFFLSMTSTSDRNTSASGIVLGQPPHNMSAKVSLMTQCSVSKCRELTKGEICQVLNVMALAFPPPIFSLGDGYVAEMHSKLWQTYLYNVPGALSFNMTEANATLVRQFPTPRVIDGRKYQYIFYVGLYSETSGQAQPMLRLLRKSLLEFLKDVAYPFEFEKEMNYVCFTIPYYYNNLFAMDLDTLFCPPQLLLDNLPVPDEYLFHNTTVPSLDAEANGSKPEVEAELSPVFTTLCILLWLVLFTVE